MNIAQTTLCPDCFSRMEPMLQPDLTIVHICPGCTARNPRKGKARKGVQRTEEDVIQTRAVEELRRDGFLVHVNTVRWKQQSCPSCKTRFWAQGGTGQTKGISDLAVREAWWLTGLWGHIEMKAPDTVLSPEQKKLREQKAMFVAYSVADALEIARVYRMWMQMLLGLDVPDPFAEPDALPFVME